MLTSCSNQPGTRLRALLSPILATALPPTLAEPWRRQHLVSTPRPRRVITRINLRLEDSGRERASTGHRVRIRLLARFRARREVDTRRMGLGMIRLSGGLRESWRWSCICIRAGQDVGMFQHSLRPGKDCAKVL